MEFNANVVHLIAGGAAGTSGAVITCPLEVVKTRLQSSMTSFVHVNVHAALRLLPTQQVVTIGGHNCHVAVPVTPEPVLGTHVKSSNSQGLVVCLRHIIKTEGIKGLFKGLGPTLIGVAPSRAIYFGAYAKTKSILNNVVTPETHFVHLCSATSAGVSAVTLTNPIWFVKTRLQLDSKKDGKLKCRDCIRQVYQKNGLMGFYKGISASYYGVTETVIHLVIYEAIKAHLQTATPKHDRSKQSNDDGSDSNKRPSFVTSDYFRYMMAGASSKTFATCLCYPHEVARTRLREEGNRYKSFFQTLLLVYKEEGRAGIYRGLGTQLIRQIPNTAVVMATYEFVVHLLMPGD